MSSSSCRATTAGRFTPSAATTTRCTAPTASGASTAGPRSSSTTDLTLASTQKCVDSRGKRSREVGHDLARELLDLRVAYTGPPAHEIAVARIPPLTGVLARRLE